MVIEVLAQKLEPVGVGSVEPAGADLSIEHQADVLEHLEVLRDGGPAHRESRGDLSDRQGSVAQAVEDGLAGRIAQGGEHRLYVRHN